tara:strand:- start:1380 stop:2159 length:780 start_codon:yes stop_codon:yes gene_type:complete
MTGIISELGPIDLFWIPLISSLVGIVLLFTRNPFFVKLIGSIITAIGLLFLLLSPWSLPNSPSSAFGQLLLIIMGPTLLISITFFANKLEKDLSTSIFGKFLSAFSLIFGLLWFLLLWAIPPQWNSLTNPFWLEWWSTFLLMHTLSLCFGTIIISKGNVKLGLISSLAGIILIITFSLFSSGESTNLEFRAAYMDSFLTLLGVVLGLIIGLVTWIKFIQIAENNRTKLPLMELLTSDEIDRVKEIIEVNVRGGGNNDGC